MQYPQIVQAIEIIISNEFPISGSNTKIDPKVNPIITYIVLI